MIYPTKDDKYNLDVWCENFREIEGDIRKLKENGSDKKRYLLFENVGMSTDLTISLAENISAEKKAEFGINDDNYMSYSAFFEKYRMILYVNTGGNREKVVLECLDAENLIDPTKGVYASWNYYNNSSNAYVPALIGFKAGYNNITVERTGDSVPSNLRITCYLEEL